MTAPGATTTRHHAAARGLRRGRTLVTAAALLVAVAAVVVALARPGAGSPRPWDCVSANDVRTVTSWSRLAGRRLDCAVAFTDAAPTWQSWEHPWVVGYRQNVPRYDWVDWFDHGHAGRHLILTQSMIPSDLRGSDWLAQGAAGAYEGHARALATSLVRAGMGSVVIRLGHEANGTWYADSIPDTPEGERQWVRFWDNTVRAMRSVPGAQFRFDWTVNAGVRPIPLGSIYPGDGFVDVIGVDAYDSFPGQAPRSRLRALLQEPDGLLAVREFAHRHDKPMSIPEWGIGPAGEHGAVGDDPGYVDAIARVVQRDNVLYQSYFSGGAEGRALRDSPRSLAAYRRHFGSAQSTGS